MNLYGSLHVYSKDTFSEHYSLSPSILMATFHMKAFSNIENI
jgi:hypothetical protein